MGSAEKGPLWEESVEAIIYSTRPVSFHPAMFCILLMSVIPPLWRTLVCISQSSGFLAPCCTIPNFGHPPIE
jgi:hypothetical protein